MRQNLSFIRLLVYKWQLSEATAASLQNNEKKKKKKKKYWNFVHW